MPIGLPKLYDPVSCAALSIANTNLPPYHTSNKKTVFVDFLFSAGLFLISTVRPTLLQLCKRDLRTMLGRRAEAAVNVSRAFRVRDDSSDM